MLVQPVKKAMGLRKGEAIERLGCPIRIVSTERQQLTLITQQDVIREGFPDWTPEQFCKFLADHYRIDPLSAFPNRIEFEYVEAPARKQLELLEV